MATTKDETSKDEAKETMTHHSLVKLDCYCNHLNGFKEFLCEFTKDAVVTNEGSGGGGGVGENINGTSNVELRPFILTRTNTETYPLLMDELPAEIIICIWQWLQQKQCPGHFQIGILRMCEGEVGIELKSAKIQEDLKAKPVEGSAKDEIFIDLLKLQKFINQYMEKMFIRLTDNSKENELENFADCKRDSTIKCEVLTKSKIPPYVEAHIKNKHRKMEDRHICLPRFSDIYQVDESFSFYAVLDGHSGSLAATYATNQIPYLIAQQLRTRKEDSDLEIDLYTDILESTFLKADQNFAKKRLGSGTTAVCALLRKDKEQQQFNRLQVAWVGDSRCLLVSPSSHLQLVKSHKPDSQDERKRIESLETGGSVIYVQGQWRVNGIINVSRSIGDYTVKAVIAEPDIVDVPLQPSHDFLILGSDGLYDHVAENEIIDCVYKALAADADNQSLDDIPKHLIELAKQGDSQDNITVVLVLLKEAAHIKNNYTKHMNQSST